MASYDGVVRILVDVDGKEVQVAQREIDKLGDAGQRTGKDMKQTEDGMKGVNRESGKATGNVKKFATALGLIAVGAMAFRTLRRSMDQAISRFDTLNQFPRVLEALGVSSEDAEKSIQRLSDGIDGLPTKLDDIASTAQRMYTSFNDMDTATESALALNNALLASGSSAADAQRGTEQYLKALQTGRFELDTWNSLSETMDVGLVKVAESFGFAGRSAKMDLYEALRDGVITVDQFNDKLIELGTGTGDLVNLARENSVGLATSWANIRTAVARGVTLVIESFDKMSREITGKGLAENIDGLKEVVMSSFRTIANVIEASTPVVRGFVEVISFLSPVLKPVAAILAGLIAATLAWVAAKTAAKVAMAALNPLIRGFTLAQGALTTATATSTVAMTTATGAAGALRVAMTAMTGPVGLAVTGIAAVAGAAVGFVKWLNRSSKEAERLKEETEELAEATDELKDSVEESAEAYEDNQKEIESTSKANRDLARRIDELSRKENKSASDKALLKSYVDQLNDSVEDLNLTYDEEMDALSMTTDELNARLDVMKETEKQQAAEQRLAEIMKEQNDVQMQLDEINAKRKEWNELLDDGGKNARDARDGIEELDEQEQKLKDTLAELAEQHEDAENQITESTRNITKAIEENNLLQIQSYEDLSDEQKKAFDKMVDQYKELRDTATNAFERIRDESKVSGDEMLDNLDHNLEMMEQWGDNAAYLIGWAAERGHIDFIREIEKMGIDNAAELNEIANMTEEQLEEMAQKYKAIGEMSGDAYKNTLGEGFDDVVDLLVNHLDVTEETARQMLTNAGFKDMGEDIPENLSDGIESGSGKVITSAKNLLNNVANQFDGSKSSFNNIGSNLIAGIRSGFESGQGSLLTSIRNVASNVVRSTQREFQIYSPSRLMRDKIGKYIPEGIAVGIKLNADAIDQEMNRLSNRMITGTPEQALGTGRMVYSSGGSQRTGTGSNVSVVRSAIDNTINVETGDVIMDGRVVGEIVWRPVKESIDRSNNRKRKIPRGGGAFA